MSDTTLEVGRVIKPHGFRGEVIVDFYSDRPERVSPGSVLTAGDRQLEVVRSKPHKNRWIVSFDGVDDEASAESLRDQALFGEAIDDPDALFVHDLVGKEVVEANGTPRGKVVAVQANPASDLLELESGSLVPLTFVTSNEETIVIDPPEGLFDE